MVKKRYTFTEVNYITINGNEIERHAPHTLVGKYNENGALKILKDLFPDKKIGILSVEHKQEDYFMDDSEFLELATKI